MSLIYFGAPKRNYLRVALVFLAVALGILALLLTACGPTWQIYQAGVGTLYVGDRLDVEAACARMGTVAPSGKIIKGCGSQMYRIAYSTEEPRMIAEEICHMILGDPEHALCAFRESR